MLRGQACTRFCVCFGRGLGKSSNELSSLIESLFTPSFILCRSNEHVAFVWTFPFAAVVATLFACVSGLEIDQPELQMCDMLDRLRVSQDGQAFSAHHPTRIFSSLCSNQGRRVRFFATCCSACFQFLSLQELAAFMVAIACIIAASCIAASL